MAAAQVMPFAVLALDVEILLLLTSPLELLAHLAQPAQRAMGCRVLDVVGKEGVDAVTVARPEGDLNRRNESLGSLRCRRSQRVTVHRLTRRLKIGSGGYPSSDIPALNVILGPGGGVRWVAETRVGGG
jgi:hypothetical protein